MDEYIELANFIHGFSDHKSSYDEKVAGGSTVLNRLESGKGEFGTDGLPPTNIREVLYSKSSPYYEVQGKNERYNNAAAGKVAKYNEASYKESLQIARGLITGEIARKKGEFIIRPSERKMLEEKGGFDFTKVSKHDSLERYDMYGYDMPVKNVQTEKKNVQSETEEEINVQTEVPTYTGKFGDAFKDARKSGHKTFVHNGKLFNTKLKGE